MEPEAATRTSDEKFLPYVFICNDKNVICQCQGPQIAMTLLQVLNLSKKGKMAEKVKNVSKEGIVLVEFKAPRELVELFDVKSRSRFSSRSEAIRALMRRFLDETV